MPEISKKRALEMLRGGAEGVRAWNEYRKATRPLQSQESFDLSELDFGNAHLEKAELRFVNLKNSRFSSAWIKHADLWGANFANCTIQNCNFLFSELSRCNFDGATVNRSSVSQCDLANSSWQNAALNRVDLIYSNLTGTTFKNAHLDGVVFDGSDLAQADFSGSGLVHLNFSHVHLVDLDLTPFAMAAWSSRGLDNYVDWKAVAKSIREPRLGAFLVWLGVPEIFATYLIDCARSLSGEELFSMLQSTFISYGAPDQGFAQKLHEALQRNGVRTFFFPEHAVPGTRLSSMMNKGVNEFDRVILICSNASLQRTGVRSEIQLSLDREAREGAGDRLIPVTLDKYVFTEWWPEKPENARAIRDKVIADFCDPNEFDSQLMRLIGALKKTPLSAGTA